MVVDYPKSLSQMFSCHLMSLRGIKRGILHIMLFDRLGVANFTALQDNFSRFVVRASRLSAKHSQRLLLCALIFASFVLARNRLRPASTSAFIFPFASVCA